MWLHRLLPAAGHNFRTPQRFPDKAALYIYGGDACKKLGRYDEALSYWDKALEIDPAFYAARYSKIFYYEETGGTTVEMEEDANLKIS